MASGGTVEVLVTSVARGAQERWGSRTRCREGGQNTRVCCKAGGKASPKKCKKVRKNGGGNLKVGSGGTGSVLVTSAARGAQKRGAGRKGEHPVGETGGRGRLEHASEFGK